MALFVTFETDDVAGHSPTGCKVPHVVHSVLDLSGCTDDDDDCGGFLVLLLPVDFCLGHHLARPSIDLISPPVGLTVLICHCLQISKHSSSII